MLSRADFQSAAPLILYAAQGQRTTKNGVYVGGKMRKALWIAAVMMLATSPTFAVEHQVSGDSLSADGWQTRGTEVGKLHAQADVNSMPWFTAFVVCGGLGGLIGSGVVVVAGWVVPYEEPSAERVLSLAKYNDDYRKGYLKGFREESESDRTIWGITGMVVGFAVYEIYVNPAQHRN